MTWKTRSTVILLTACLLGGTGLATVDAAVIATTITSGEQLLTGSVADSEIGDLLLQNDNIAVVISALGHLTYHGLSGGNVIDAGKSDDRIDALGELYTYFDDDWPRQAIYESLVILDDGSGGGPAVIRSEGVDSMDPSLTVITDYYLAEDADYLIITTLVENTGGGSYPSFELGDAFQWGACQKFAPGYGFAVSGTTTEPWIAGAALVAVSYGYLGGEGDVWGPHGSAWSDLNVTTAHLGPGDTAGYVRYLAVGDGDVASVATVIHGINGTPVGTVDCTVTSQDDGLPLAGATIDAFDNSESIYLQMETDAAGLVTTTLPAGDWRLEASAAGHLPEETWLTVAVGGTYSHEFSLATGGGLPTAIGDTLTVIQRPLLNIPALVVPGDTLEIGCVADPATTGWTAALEYGALEVLLPVVAAVHDPATLWWTVSAIVPPVSLYELYDLRVTADGGLDDVTRNAVRVMGEFKNDYYFVHITDTHLPDHRYSSDGGTPADSTEMVDLREVINDINLINPEFVLLTGDFVNEGELEDYLDWRCYTRGQRILTELEVPVFLTAGNHDLGGWPATPPPDGTARRDWWRFFGWKRLDAPPPGAPWYTQNYSFDYGPVHFSGLEAYDNYDMWRSEIYGSESFTDGQLQWLAADLAGASGSAAQVLFYHFDFQNQLNLNALGVEMALWGHVHSNQGSLTQQPYDLATKNVCGGARAYRVVRVSGSTLTPLATMNAGATGQNLRVQYTPANDGSHDEVSAQVTNTHAVQFEHGLVRFLMPKGGSYLVDGGTLLQVDNSGEFAVCHVGVDIPADGVQIATVTRDPSAVPPGIPAELFLGQNQPNPFNPLTTLEFSLPRPGPVRLAVHDVRGRVVAVLASGDLPAGRHTARWDGRDLRGQPASSGVYFVRLQADGESRIRKIVLAR